MVLLVLAEQPLYLHVLPLLFARGPLQGVPAAAAGLGKAHVEHHGKYRACSAGGLLSLHRNCYRVVGGLAAEVSPLSPGVMSSLWMTRVMRNDALKSDIAKGSLGAIGAQKRSGARQQGSLKY